ncbi:MAG: chloride channel protein [Myxococcota bacterium]
MARRTFQNLDAEARALHDSWDHIARLVFVTSMVALVVWGACTLLRMAVHASWHALLHALEHTGAWWSAGLLVGGLVLAGAARGLLLRRWPEWQEAAGDGMEVALSNYHVTYQREGDDPQPRYERAAFGLALRKAVMTWLTLGPGGSGGLEAPTVLMAESLSAGVSRVMQVRSEFELRTYQLAGMAAAVATLLGAPFTAALFATEVAYGDRIIYRKLAYCMWAAVVAYFLNNRLYAYEPLFPAPVHGATYRLTEYAATAIVAVAVSAPAAVGFGFVMTQTRKLVARVRPELHGAVTGLATAAVALLVWRGLGIGPEHVLGMGEETVSGLLAGDPALGAWWVLCAVLLGRLATTALTQSSGGSAGLLVPTMVVGAVAGGLTAQILDATGAMSDLDRRCSPWSAWRAGSSRWSGCRSRRSRWCWRCSARVRPAGDPRLRRHLPADAQVHAVRRSAREPGSRRRRDGLRLERRA